MIEYGAGTHGSTDRGVLYLTRGDVESLALGMAQVVDAIEAVFRAKGRGAAAMPPKASVHGEAGAFSQVMAAALPDALGAKWVCLFPANLRRGLPTLHGLLLLSDPETGVPRAVMDAALVTALRTGASAALAARYLARPGPNATASLPTTRPRCWPPRRAGCGLRASPPASTPTWASSRPARRSAASVPTSASSA